jgi:hypothetical protein
MGSGQAMADSNEYKVKVSGPGHVFDRSISEQIANAIINLVITGNSVIPKTSDSAAAGGKQLPALNNMSPKQFMASKKAGTQYERVACLAYYLTHMREISEFKTAQITKLNTEAALSKLSNPAAAVDHATSTYGFLSAAGGGKKQISVRGEALVEALPDRQAVKLALEEHKLRPRKKRSAKKKKS